MLSANWAPLISSGKALLLLPALLFCSNAATFWAIESKLSHSFALGPKSCWSFAWWGSADNASAFWCARPLQWMTSKWNSCNCSSHLASCPVGFLKLQSQLDKTWSVQSLYGCPNKYMQKCWKQPLPATPYMSQSTLFLTCLVCNLRKLLHA